MRAFIDNSGLLIVGTVVFAQCGGLDPVTSQAFFSPAIQCTVE